MRKLALPFLLLGCTHALSQTVAHDRLTGLVEAPTGCHWTAAERPWLTPAEQSCYASTPTYDETTAYLKRVQTAAPAKVRIEPFGRTGEGRELDVVIVSHDGVFDPAAIHASKRLVILVQNSIHAGEMDGKDACLALLRDMVISRSQAALLDHAVFVFIPIYNADGHERRSPYNRINQDGPAEIGWRANGSNLNLNRDYMKADAPETRGFLAMYNRWNPDVFVDDHVTDGADFQYDVTYSIDDTPNLPPATTAWVDGTLAPAIKQVVDAHGHLAATTYIELVDEKNLLKGIALYDDPPRFSTGFATLTGRPSMLIEMHMLKDYRTRVTGNYWTLVGLLQTVNAQAPQLLALNTAADVAAKSWTGKSYPLSFDWSGTTTPFAFAGYSFTTAPSDVSGTDWVQYTHTKQTMTVPLQTGYKNAAAVTAPMAYLVPAQWTAVIERLMLHGIAFTRTTAEYDAVVDTYQCGGMTWQDPPFEGHHPTFSGEASHGAGRYGQCAAVKQMRHFPVGSVVVKLDQRLSGVAMSWLEPDAPDSALQWGFFDPIFEQKEYGEGYVVERLAREMMAADPALKAEFEAKLAADPKFAASPQARLNFFYQRSEYGKANRVGKYPVARLMSLDGVPQ